MAPGLGARMRHLLGLMHDAFDVSARVYTDIRAALETLDVAVSAYFPSRPRVRPAAACEACPAARRQNTASSEGIVLCSFVQGEASGRVGSLQVGQAEPLAEPDESRVCGQGCLGRSQCQRARLRSLMAGTRWH